MESLEIRPVAPSDLEVLGKTFRSEFDRTHADDLKEQIEGDKSFFVAWLAHEPVGHALVRWLGPRAEVPYDRYSDTPEIYRLAVLEPYQRRGIASKIISCCENEARRRGFTRIGLGTDPDIDADSNLYYKLGYSTSDAVRFDESYKRRAADGSVTTVQEKTTFLIKSLQ